MAVKKNKKWFWKFQLLIVKKNLILLGSTVSIIVSLRICNENMNFVKK